MDNFDLKHYGIRGMRWGVRRFQNEDGSLTPRGNKKKSKSSNQTKKDNNTNSTKQKSSGNRKHLGKKTVGTILATNYVGKIGMSKYLFQSGPQRTVGAAIVAGAAAVQIGSIINYAKNRKGGE